MRILSLIVLAAAGAYGRMAAQAADPAGAYLSPFLFTTVGPGPGAAPVLSLELGYNERAFEPIAGESIEPRASLVVPISPSVSILAHLGVAGTLDHRTRLAEQAEVLLTPLRMGGLSLTGGLGLRHEYAGTVVSLLRLGAAHATARSTWAADLLLEPRRRPRTPCHGEPQRIQPKRLCAEAISADEKLGLGLRQLRVLHSFLRHSLLLCFDPVTTGRA